MTRIFEILQTLVIPIKWRGFWNSLCRVVAAPSKCAGYFQIDPGARGKQGKQEVMVEQPTYRSQSAQLPRGGPMAEELT
jgi:hypothetical protein